MIYTKIKNWKDLQQKVCLLLNQAGFIAETEKRINTPRGTIEIDVFAYDPKSIDKITYIIECKNWKNKIPQTVIHSFLTVMNETGGNIGYLISKNGFQKGSYDFINSTNIKVLTFEELQSKYLNIWLKNYFIKELKDSTNSFLEYTEQINSRRFRYYDNLELSSKKLFDELFEKYQLLGNVLAVFLYSTDEKINFPEIKELTLLFSKEFGIVLKSSNYSDLLIELKQKVADITNKFNNVFNENIFA